MICRAGTSFRQQLRELNYVEGQNLAYVYLRTDGSPDQLDAAAMALAQLPVNVIVAFAHRVPKLHSGLRRQYLSSRYRSAIRSGPDW